MNDSAFDLVIGCSMQARIAELTILTLWDEAHNPIGSAALRHAEGFKVKETQEATPKG